MRIAYADPPYIGCAHRYHEKKEVNHQDLIRELAGFDGWALSLTSTSLGQVLSMCPNGVRVMAWVKPFCAFKKNVNPAYAWEPVIVSPARKPKSTITVRDWIAESITLRKGLIGAKPDAFCYWLFDVLGLLPEDEFMDLFPGTGRVKRAWEAWRSA
jgi:hypothetical protein